MIYAYSKLSPGVNKFLSRSGAVLRVHVVLVDERHNKRLAARYGRRLKLHPTNIVVFTVGDS